MYLFGETMTMMVPLLSFLVFTLVPTVEGGHELGARMQEPDPVQVLAMSGRATNEELRAAYKKLPELDPMISRLVRIQMTPRHMFSRPLDSTPDVEDTALLQNTASTRHTGATRTDKNVRFASDRQQMTKAGRPVREQQPDLERDYESGTKEQIFPFTTEVAFGNVRKMVKHEWHKRNSTWMHENPGGKKHANAKTTCCGLVLVFCVSGLLLWALAPERRRPWETHLAMRTNTGGRPLCIRTCFWDLKGASGQASSVRDCSDLITEWLEGGEAVHTEMFVISLQNTDVALFASMKEAIEDKLGGNYTLISQSFAQTPPRPSAPVHPKTKMPMGDSDALVNLVFASKDVVQQKGPQLAIALANVHLRHRPTASEASKRHFTSDLMSKFKEAESLNLVMILGNFDTPESAKPAADPEGPSFEEVGENLLLSRLRNTSAQVLSHHKIDEKHHGSQAWSGMYLPVSCLLEVRPSMS
eukprot:gnl/TRDRNA2_/TRDRNA2_183467_c0_seq1.p1 gnl/TRDRNA2_/TRDRNA2_183467_c0~~gnl/TRDRNA2_/TRDRNA2_183467_c0_seq1.p1  ORF type:complete len:472 (-),score=94.05 gnl/TRDRNA2_/TRDRNA2_183467_c0_seq1:57-1472(-)